VGTLAAGRIVATGTAAITALALTSVGLHPPAPDLATHLGVGYPRSEMVSVRLQSAVISAAVTVAAIIPEPPAGLRAPATTTAAVSAGAAAPPEEILTNAARAALSVVVAAAWFGAFPVTLPASLLLGGWVSFAVSYFGGHPTTGSPLVGLSLFVDLPIQLVQNAFTALKDSLAAGAPTVGAETTAPTATSVAKAVPKPAGAPRAAAGPAPKAVPALHAAAEATITHEASRAVALRRPGALNATLKPAHAASGPSAKRPAAAAARTGAKTADGSVARRTE
jgi:hypothetical protein